MTAANKPLHRTLTIKNQRGLHARAAAKFVNLANEFDATITVTKDGQSVDGKSIMGLMMLAAGIGSQIQIQTSGAQAEAALEAMQTLIENKFGEAC